MIILIVLIIVLIIIVLVTVDAVVVIVVVGLVMVMTWLSSALWLCGRTDGRAAGALVIRHTHAFLISRMHSLLTRIPRTHTSEHVSHAHTATCILISRP